MRLLKRTWIKFVRMARIAGPGLITGASDDDPSGIATYSQAGAISGFSTLWTALLTFPLMAAIQEMCARIGLVTCQGLAGCLKDHYPKWVVYTMLIVSFPAITLNIGADLEGMAAVSHMLFPAIPIFAFSVAYGLLIIIIIIRLSWNKVAGILKWLCIVLFLYLVVPFSVKVNWPDVLKHTFIPVLHWNKDFLSILVAILGTTISPYLFFWQATMEAEDVANQPKKRIMVDKRALDNMKTDVNIGMLFSNLVMFFIILTAGAVLFPHGIKKIDTIEQAAQALAPLTGPFTYLLFSIGVIGTGLLAVPVLAGSLSYIMAEAFKLPGSFSMRFSEAKAFYLTIIISVGLGLCIDFFGISPVQALIYTAILYGLTAPFMIVLVLHICNSPKIMGKHTNSLRSNIMGILTLLIMTSAAVGLILYL